jgi:hypothetical protein
MAKALASAVIDAPVEAVWDIVRDFGALPSWVPGLGPCHIEDGLAPDVVGCVRAFQLGDGAPVREQLTMLDDSRYSFAYTFVTPAFPVEDYHATFRLIPVTSGDRTFAQWSAQFEEAPTDKGKYERIISQNVFAAGLAALGERVRERRAPPGAVRWQGFRPAKVFCSSVLPAPVAAVWERMRDFGSMDQWHPDLADMHMLGGARSDKVSGVRDFRLGDGRLQEQLTLLCDRTHAFRYKINASPMPWLNYHAGAQLYPVTATETTFAVWTADWVAAPNDDADLIPLVHQRVFQLAFDTLAAQLAGRG